MTELDVALVRRKLSSITRNLQHLNEVVGLSLDEYTGDRFRQKGTERMLQEVVEAAADDLLEKELPPKPPPSPP